MSFTAIMAATPVGRLAKRADFLSEADADAHVATHAIRFPDAFVVPTLVEPEGHWLLDMVEKTITIVAPPVPVPPMLYKLQLVRALRAAGHWGDVKAALAQSDTVTKEDWDYVYKINRDDPMMETFAGALDLTPADVDALFISGATL